MTFKVTLEPPVLSPGNSLSVTVCGIQDTTSITNMSIGLVRIDKDYSEWVFGWGEKPSLRDDVLTVSTMQTGDLRLGIHEVATIKISYVQGTPSSEVTFVPGRDFERIFLDVVPTGLKGRTQDVLKQEVMQIEKTREVEFLKGLDVEPIGERPHSYRIYVFLGQCLIHNRIRLGQSELLPLGELSASEHIELLEVFFQKLGGSCPKEFLDRVGKITKAQNPVTVVHFPLIRAVGQDEAKRFVLERCPVINDLLSLHRSSYGRILGILMSDMNSGESLYIPVIEPYRGNLLAGFISGEDPRTIRDNLVQVLSDISLQLFLSLYRQGEAEVNVDFGYFRYWNLLEAMAVRYIPDGINITDIHGTILMSKNKAVTTVSGIGRVYQLIKSHFESGQIAENPFTSSLPSNRSLWELCQIWYAFRNATAHYGGFDPNNPIQRRKPWYSIARSAYNEIVATKPVRTIETDSYYDALKETARIVLRRQITFGLNP